VAKGQGHNPLIRNILKVVTDTRLGSRQHFYVGPTGYRLAPSHLTLDDLESSKIKVVLFDGKCVENDNSYNVGLMGFTLDDLERLEIQVTIL